MLGECKHCGSTREIKLKRLDKDKYVPVCIECGTEQDNFSTVMINAMKANKDIVYSKPEASIPFGFLCKACNKQQEMVYDRKNRVARCSTCGSVANVSPYMLRSLEITGRVLPSREAVVENDEGAPVKQTPKKKKADTVREAHRAK